MKQAALESRRLGAGGLTVPAVGLGCMGMSDGYGPADRARLDRDDQARAGARRELAGHRGRYGRGHNEELVGEAWPAP